MVLTPSEYMNPLLSSNSGFPYPDNLELAKHLEKSVRDHGAVPATIGVLNGVIRVGMSAEESEQLLETSRQPTTIKLSRRDISYICGLVINLLSTPNKVDSSRD